MPSDLTPQDREALGIAARGILRYALSEEHADRWLYSAAIAAACRTYETNPVDTGAVIRELLQPDRLSRHGFAALHWLANEIPALIRHDPLLVEEIYTRAFTYREVSEDQTPLGGALLPLVSTRKQDYDHGLYELARVYGSFVEAAPLEATRALLHVVDGWVIREHTYGEQPVETAINLLGLRAILRTDFSHSWDESSAYEHQHERRMLDAWQEALARLVPSENGVETLRKVVDVVVTTNRVAVVWRRLFILGTQHPAAAGQALKPLLSSPGLLAAMDLEDVAGDFLAAAFADLPTGDRATVERAILSIPGLSGQQNGEKIRDRLLGRLPADALVTDEARDILHHIDEVPRPRRRRPGVTVGFGEPDREEDILRELGVPVDEPQNRRLQELGGRLSGIAAKFRTKTSVPDDVGPALDLVRELRDAIEAAPREGVHPGQAKRSLGMLADACAEIAEHGEGPAFETGLPLITACLLDAAMAPDEEIGQGADSGFDEHPFWSATPHISAAAGLLCVAWHGTDERLLAVIEELGRHPAKEVRFQVAWRSRRLLRSAPDFFWALADRLAREEESPGVLQGLLSSLQQVAGRDPDRTAAIATMIYDRIKDHPKGKAAREICIDIFVGLYIWRGQPDCGAFVTTVADDPTHNLEAAAQLPFRLREPLVHGPTSPPQEQAEAVRQRACGAFRSLTRAAVVRWHAVVAKSQTGPPPGADERKEGESLAHLLDSLAGELYFASGSFKESSRAREHGPLPDDVRRRFYAELGPAMDDLAEVGLPSLAHHLVETLEDMVAFDPPGVFRRVAAVVKAAQRYGYTYESLAAERIVNLVRRYLADYRPLLQDDAGSRQALMDVLNAFVHWPEASRLVFQLEDIWR